MGGVSRESLVLLDWEVRMARKLNRRRGLLASGLGICAWAFIASPAGAATTTLLCLFPDPPGGTYVVDLDYAAKTITLDVTAPGEPGIHFGPSAAAITDRTITFELRNSSSNVRGYPAGTWSHTIKGSIDRLAGALAVTVSAFYKGQDQGAVSFQLRCRPATQKF